MMHATPAGRHDAPVPGPDPARRGAAQELGLLQVCYLVFLLPWFLLAIGGTMGLANWESIVAAFVILAWWAYPFVALGTAIAAWALFATRRHGAARWVNRVPLVWVLVGVALLLWIWLATA
ncbi:hypothetical protein [Blastococcus goldschmidtiae]|uniref:Transmembrane protein n=1 Tax=Blastococcus goldschmidtiae TaxID=3075546 RepID=A0ABU2KDP4_9ACTN|nr:hypothetical protein [Blastococcus sp. DSM 46792]MDT0278317.1 hypothetical protein [Blastococcus sp. DSM 46792]